MGILNSLYSGVSGLQANGKGMSVISDNVANVNTVGFKKSRANFQDLMSMTVLGVGNFSQIGMGTAVMNVQQLFQQGSFENSSSATDLAINGGGFFLVNGEVNGLDGDFYTRAGQFIFDKDGFLVNQLGLRIQGYSVDPQDPDGAISGGLGDIKITHTQIQPNPTSEVEVNANLDSDVETGAGLETPLTHNEALENSDFHTVITTYDSLGNAHDLTIYFAKTGDNTWEMNIAANGDEINGGTNGQISWLFAANQEIQFDGDGHLTSIPDPIEVSVDFAGGSTQGQTITFDMGEVLGPDEDYDPSNGGLTQYAGGTAGNDSAVHFVNQDGYPTGNLRFINVNEDGLITGAYSNGEILNLGKIALANFVSNTGLKKLGGNLWAETTQSGQPLIGEANTGPRGTIMGNSLEQSNVDLAEEFVDMIVTQKGFDANSKAIQTTDRMLDTVLQLKR